MRKQPQIIAESSNFLLVAINLLVSRGQQLVTKVNHRYIFNVLKLSPSNKTPQNMAESSNPLLSPIILMDCLGQQLITKND